MKRLLALAVIATAALFSQAQSQPGYLGRRNIIRYDVFAMPSLFNSGAGLLLHHSHQLAYERILSRRTVFGGGIGMLPLFSISRQLTTPTQIDGIVKRKSMGLGIHVKWHPFLRKGWLAPMGPYFKLSFQFNQLRSTFLELPDLTAAHPWSQHFYAAYAMEFGYSELLLGRVVVDFGVRFCIADIMHGAAGGTASTDPRVYRDAFDLLESELFKLRLGLGFLL